MTEDEEVQAPPPSIDIGTLQFDADDMAKDETESMTVPEETTDTSPAVVKPDNEPVNMQPLSQDANDAYATYIKIKEAKPSDGASYAGIAVIFAGFIFGFMTIENDVESAFTSCCLGIFLGIILIALGANEQEKWKKEKKLKLDEALVKAGIPDIPRENQKPLGISLLVLGICALVTTNLFYNYYIIESVVFIVGLGSILSGIVVLLRMNQQDSKAMKKRMAILEQKRNAE